METRNRQCTCKGPVAGRGRSGTDWRGGPQSARTRIRRHWPSRASHCQTPGTRRNDQRRSQVEAAFVLGAIHAHSPNHAPPEAVPEAPPLPAAHARARAWLIPAARARDTPRPLPARDTLPLRSVSANQGRRPGGGGARANTKGQKPTQSPAL